MRDANIVYICANFPPENFILIFILSLISLREVRNYHRCHICSRLHNGFILPWRLNLIIFLRRGAN